MSDAITRLEEKIAYLERHVTEQDKAMLEITDELTRLRRETRRLRDLLDAASPPRGGPVDELTDDRPPHY